MQEEFTGKFRLGKVPHFTDANEFPVGPALQAYLDRVANALGVPVERRSIRTWVFVQEDRDRYHYDAVVISIDLKTHEIRCNDPAYQSEDAEQIKITEELETSVKWPKSISTSESAVQHGLRADIRKLRGKDPILFPFPDGHGGVCFVQERIIFENDPDMKKIDLPWTWWNDGKWRNIEPGGELPLFGLDQLSTASMVCIHEGAKSASCVLEMVKSGEWKNHPWGEDLRLSKHLGWPGGAPNSHRVDWTPIRRLSLDVPCVLVCDNDVSGINAAPKISGLLLRPLRAIRFDVRFDPHFDLADAFPKAMWKPNSKGVLIYKGPSFYDCMFPATWATEKKGKTVSLRAPFAAEWLHTVKPETFVHRDIPKYWTMAQFNSLVKPFAHAKDVASLVRDQLHGKAEKLAYNPGEKTGMVTTDDGSALNVYRPSLIKAKTKAKTGDDKLWVEFLEHLIPEEKDRLETLRWCATLVCCPEVRMRYGLLLISEVQGVGKSTLFVILTALVGPWNVSLPTEKDIVGSEFNAWKAKKRLAVIHEIYSGHSKAAYNRLKDTITEDTVDVNEKFIAPYTLHNWTHVASSSNAIYALHLDDSDRRWLAPRVTEELPTDKDPDYWKKFYSFLNDDDGFAIIRWSLEQFLKTNDPVSTSHHAPMTGAKREIIAESRPPGARMAYELAEEVTKMAREKDDNDRPLKPVKVVLSVSDVRAWVAGRRQMSLDDPRLESPLMLRKALKAGGLKEPRRVAGQGEVRRFNIDGLLHFVVANFVIEPDVKWPSPGLKDLYKKPNEVLAF